MIAPKLELRLRRRWDVIASSSVKYGFTDADWGAASRRVEQVT